MVLPGAPRLIAMPPAVLPLPYSLVCFESAVAQVLCLVVLSGFTPAPCESDALQPAYLLCGFGAVWVCVWLCELVALELVDELDEDVDDEEDDVAAFFSCPGGVPCGFPASATPVAAASARQAAAIVTQ